MSKRILKHVLSHRTGTFIRFRGDSILDAQAQDGKVVIWTISDPGNEHYEQEYRFVWTGDWCTDDFLEQFNYVATIQLSEIVEHLFIKIQP